MKKRQFIKSTIAPIALCALMGINVLAAYDNWTSYETSYLSDVVTSDNTSKRYTNNSQFGVYVKDKTMWSSPTAQIVNSEGNTRSNTVTLSSTEEYLYGSGNKCEANYKYNLKIKKAWNQVGTDTLTYKFSVR